MTPDRQELRRVFGLFATGVTVITTRDAEGGPVGLTANSLSSVSLDPPLVLWCLDNRSRRASVFSFGAVFAIHILSEQQADIALRFARSGVTKFADEDRRAGDEAPPEIDGALARIDCVVSALHGAGDHTIIVGEVQAARALDMAPLVFQKSRFGRFVCDPAYGGDEALSQLIDMWS